MDAMRKRAICMVLLGVLLVSCKGEKYNVDNSSITAGENKTVSLKSKEYYAKEDKGFNIIYDYDSVVSICNDICEEFVRAVTEHNKADFSPYINNENLKEYMQYRVDNHIYSYDETSIYKLMITEVKFHDEYVLISGITGAVEEPNSSSLQGINYFLIKNVDGRLYIADWYWDHMDSPDITLRGEFSEKNNLTYWDNPEKYGSILKKISNI